MTRDWHKVCDTTGFWDALDVRSWYRNRGYGTRMKPWRHWQGTFGFFWRVEVTR